MHWIKTLLFSGLFSAFSLLCHAQTHSQNITIDWKLNGLNRETPTSHLQVEKIGDHLVPFLFYRFPVLSKNVSFRMLNTQYDPALDPNVASATLLAEFQNPVAEQFVHSSNGKYELNLKLFPFKMEAGVLQKLRGFSIEISGDIPDNTLKQPGEMLNKMEFASQSNLASGDWFKCSVPAGGIYQINQELLRALGMDAVNAPIDRIRVFGQQGGTLPEPTDMPNYDDLYEIPVKTIDQNANNVLDAGDQILFYAEAADVWRFDPALGDFLRSTHYAERNNYYYISVGNSPSKKIELKPANTSLAADTALRHGDHLIVHNSDEYNFLQSGRDWWGNSFKNNTRQSFKFNIPDAQTGAQARIRHRVTARSTLSSSYTVSANGSVLFNRSLGSVPGDYQSSYHAAPVTESAGFNLSSQEIELSYEYRASTAEGDFWIDFITLQVPRELKYRNQTTHLGLRRAQNFNVIRLEFAKSEFMLWDVRDPLNPYEQLLENAADVKTCVIANDKKVPLLLLFRETDAATPVAIGKISNQNLHGAQPTEYLIVVHPELLSEANRLADFHREHYGHQTLVATTDQIYNEFSAGKQDPTAIRNFTKMLYDRGLGSSTPLRYLLLFGDGSYDYKDYTKNNTNLVPTFQSRNSYVPVSTYSSDDYYAILEDGEGYFDLNGAKEGLDIAVGRIPASNLAEAQVFVNKILSYHETGTYGDWRNRLTFLADDEDANAHFWDSEVVAAFILDQKKEYNVNKIYLDAFEQISFGSGQKYPEVNVAINKAFEKGHLIFNYLGHGGGSGMAHERVITRDQILAWENSSALPLVVTATCELSRFDDPAEKSPGELMLFSSKGGAIALITTTRLVIIGNNSDLNEQIFDHNIFELHNGRKPTLGEVYSRCKNNSAKNINQRNFILLGDPAMRIAYPDYKVVTNFMNDSTGTADTIRAFERVRVKGSITSGGQVLEDYNGFVYPTIFDKFATYRTLANDPGSYAINYRMQNSVLYRGKVSVINGEFSFQFVVPKDIAYEFGSGKISYYAEDGAIDGHGFHDDFVIGGSGEKVTDDDKGPDIKMYMDHEHFSFGGTTGPQPTLLADLFDENGVNTVGSGIGRDLLAILDEGSREEKIIILNDFYTTRLDSYQEGQIEYKMEPLPEGKHTLKLKVWDVYNNSSEAYTEFFVAPDDELKLNNLLNYPNPFTGNTTFHFDHNKAGRYVHVLIQVFTVSGDLVRTFRHEGLAASGHFQDLNWDGRDEFGDPIARGVYLYKVHMKCEDETESKAFQKLMLLH